MTIQSVAVKKRSHTAPQSRPSDGLTSLKNVKQRKSKIKQRRPVSGNDSDIPSDDEIVDPSGGIDGDEFEPQSGHNAAEDEWRDEDEYEAPEDRRLRLSQKYLEQIGVKVDDDTRSDANDDEGAIKARLDDDADIVTNKVQFDIGDNFQVGESLFLRGHKGTPTCVTLTHDNRVAFTGSKDCSIIKWDLETGSKYVYPGGRKQFYSGGHFEQVCDVCVSGDGNTLCSVGVDRVVRLWDIRGPPSKCVAAMKGHTNTISCVAADCGGGSLTSVITASHDLSLKQWNIGCRAAVTTMFGHTAPVTTMDILSPGRPLTGGEDCTCRYWKLSRQTHLLFHEPTAGAVDAVAAISPTKLLSGTQNGWLSVWTEKKKKPRYTLQGHNGHGILSLGCFRYGDVFFSGSDDGQIGVWRTKVDVDNDRHRLQRINSIPVLGAVNAMEVSKTGRLLLCAVGKEFRHGRWVHHKEAKNGLMIVKLFPNVAGMEG